MGSEECDYQAERCLREAHSVCTTTTRHVVDAHAQIYVARYLFFNETGARRLQEQRLFCIKSKRSILEAIYSENRKQSSWILKRIVGICIVDLHIQRERESLK